MSLWRQVTGALAPARRRSAKYPVTPRRSERARQEHKRRMAGDVLADGAVPFPRPGDEWSADECRREARAHGRQSE